MCRITAVGPPLVALAALTAGCSSDDHRLVELSRESLDRQAEQNEQMSRQSQQVAEATRHLVAADAQARREMAELQQQVQAERSSLDRQREQLETERREQAAARRRDSILAGALLSVALLLAAALPLVLCVYLVRNLLPANEDDALGELLIGELVAEQPVLLPDVRLQFPAIEDHSDAQGVPLAGLPFRPAAGPTEPRERAAPMLVVVEGAHDLEFLKRISAVLHTHDPELPDLGALEAGGRLIFVPAGGGNFRRWTQRFAGLQTAEFHLYDRETPPLTEERQKAADEINQRPCCAAVLTGKRSLENYLHPAAIEEAQGIRIAFEDHDDVPELAARQVFQSRDGPAWEGLPRRARRRLRERAKRWLNTTAVERMTPERLAERDPAGDVVGWLRTIDHLIHASET